MRDALVGIWITNAILTAIAVSLYVQNRRRRKQIDELKAAIDRQVQRE